MALSRTQGGGSDVGGDFRLCWKLLDGHQILAMEMLSSSVDIVRKSIEMGYLTTGLELTELGRTPPRVKGRVHISGLTKHGVSSPGEIMREVEFLFGKGGGFCAGVLGIRDISPDMLLRTIARG